MRRQDQIAEARKLLTHLEQRTMAPAASRRPMAAE